MQLQPFLLYINLALKILTGQEFGSQISLVVVDMNCIMETYLNGRRPLLEDNLCWKMTFQGVLERSRYSRRLRFGMLTSIFSGSAQPASINEHFCLYAPFSF